MTVLTISSLLLVVAMAVGLYLKSVPILQEHSLWDLLTEGEWRPMSNRFGFFPFLMGTLYVSLLALGLAIPISLLMATRDSFTFTITLPPMALTTVTLPPGTKPISARCCRSS